MAVKLEGWVDNGKGAPLPNISAIVTRVADGGIVTSGLTDADGHWQFAGLAESDEYFVNLADGAGNAIVRGPWSGELREAWIRDRLALPDSGLAVLPNGGNTTVGGLPLVLDPDPLNVLEWRVGGIFSAGAVGLTEEAADLLYEPIDSAYTKAESDALYSPIDAVVDAWTKAESDARYEPLDTMYTKAESDARYPQKTDIDPYPNYLTSTEADALFLTPAEGNAAYATSAHNHDTTYVQLTGGSVMTGLLGPSTHNTRDLGTTGTRWRALYGMTGDFTTSLTVATKPVALSPDGANTLEWRANGFYVAAGAVSDIWVNTTGDTMTGDLNMTANVLPTVTNVRDLGSTALRWRKLWATDADFTNAPTIGGAAMPYVSLHGSTMDGELWFSMGQPTVAMWEGDSAVNNRSLKLYMPSNDGRLRISAQRDDGVEGSAVIEILRSGNQITTLTTPGLSVNSRPVIMAGCAVTHNAAQTITTATTTALAFNTERYDTDAFHDTVTNNNRITIPTGHAGKYYIFANIAWGAATDANWRLVGIRLGGATFIARQSGPATTTSVGTEMNVSRVYDLAAGDYLECMVRHERGSNLDVTLNANFSPEFGLQRIG